MRTSLAWDGLIAMHVACVKACPGDCGLHCNCALYRATFCSLRDPAQLSCFCHMAPARLSFLKEMQGSAKRPPRGCRPLILKTTLGASCPMSSSIYVGSNLTEHLDIPASLRSELDRLHPVRPSPLSDAQVTLKRMRGPNNKIKWCVYHKSKQTLQTTKQSHGAQLRPPGSEHREY